MIVNKILNHTEQAIHKIITPTKHIDFWILQVRKYEDETQAKVEIVKGIKLLVFSLFQSV